MRAIGAAVAALALDPVPPEAFHRADYHRLRVGRFRVAYVVDDALITVERVDRVAADLPDEAMPELVLDYDYHTGDPELDTTALVVRRLRQQADELTATAAARTGCSSTTGTLTGSDVPRISWNIFRPLTSVYTACPPTRSRPGPWKPGREPHRHSL
jgi:hypothetical protein